MQTSRILSVGLALALLTSVAAPLLAGEEPAPPPVDTGSVNTGPVNTAAADAAKLHKQITADFNAARNDYYAVMRKRRADAELQKQDPPTAPEPEFIARHAAAAKTYAGTDAAVPFLTSIVSMGRSRQADDARAALATIVESHSGSATLDTMTFSLLYGVHTLGEDTVRGAVDALVERSPHNGVKAAMLYCRGAMVNRATTSTQDQRDTAVVDLERAIEIGGESRYVGLSKGAIFELTRLQVGMTAPDIAGDDLDGYGFKLSDYRGKVVVLDFWGDW